MNLFKKEEIKLLHNPITDVRKSSNVYLWIIPLIILLLLLISFTFFNK